MFFSFDGVDGAGKTTQMERFADWLRQQGQAVTVCRDPGSTALGERIRELVLGGHGLAIGRMSEMLLYMAARAQLVEEVIQPALQDGQTVVSDRYLLANIVYQGHAGGLDVEQLRTVGNIATSGLLPDLIFLLDLPAEAAQQRIDRPPDRMEAQGLEYLRRVRQGFLTEAARLGERVVRIDAARSREAVFDELIQTARRKLTDGT